MYKLTLYCPTSKLHCLEDALSVFDHTRINCDSGVWTDSGDVAMAEAVTIVVVLSNSLQRMDSLARRLTILLLDNGEAAVLYELDKVNAVVVTYYD